MSLINSLQPEFLHHEMHVTVQVPGFRVPPGAPQGPPAAAMDAGGSFGVGTEGGPGAASGAAAGAASVPRAAAAVSSLAPPCALARRAGGVAALLGGDAAAV